MNKTIQLFTIFSLCFGFFACQPTNEKVGEVPAGVKKQPTAPNEASTIPSPQLTKAEANRLSKLPLECIEVEYPNKPNFVVQDANGLKSPKALHPAFYGCFDWHSAVHGYWSLVYLTKKYPDLEESAEIRKRLKKNLSPQNVAVELDYFKQKGNKSFERTYGWAWLLKLAEELKTWNDPLGQELAQNLQPLSDYIAQSYISFIPKLNYPIRVGEHTNTAFGLSFAWDYAQTTQNEALKKTIQSAVNRFYKNDKGCPISWEPSGFDFLSPCLQEADLVGKVMSPADYQVWLSDFMPDLADPNYHLEVGKVSDRTDGKLVHLDGVNFSRAWCLYNIAKSNPAKYNHLRAVADKHINYSLPSIVDGNYSGTHWLASFALYGLKTGE